MFNHSQLASHSAPETSSSYLHATLERIDQLANDVTFTDGESYDRKRYLVVDTNILLSHLDALQDFVEDVEHLGLITDVSVIVPGAVIGELDGQKNRDGLAWFARRASAWILTKVRERKIVRGQADEETCKLSENWKKSSPEDREQELGLDWGQINDRLILDCCQYFDRTAGRPVTLCSADNNLCLQSESAGIPSVTPSHYFSSREIATVVFSDRNDISQFRPRFRRNRPAYTNLIDQASRPANTQRRAEDDDMGMDVDEEDALVDYTMPSHPLDLLHIQICEHFSTLLIELVSRVGGDEIHRAQKGGAAQSRYAPNWTRNANPITQWTPTECVEYLNDKKRLQPTAPPVDVFLSKKSNKPGETKRAGPARRGQDWSRADWEIALAGLRTLGNAWGDGSFQESLAVLAPHLYQVFSQRMRPTGI